MTDFDLTGLQAAAAADPRPKVSIPDEIPTGTSPSEQAVAGYTMAVNLVTRSAELDCDADWRRRQRIYATEIARLQNDGGTVDPAVLDELNTERVRATLNTRYCEELHITAQDGYERIFELIGPREVAATRTEMIERTTATVDEINALTQRLIDEYRPGASVYDFLSARTLDTTVRSTKGQP
jgi:hypothetical protein